MRTIDIVEEIIKLIESELESPETNSTEYHCENGTNISTDVGYVYDWFDEYKEVLRKKYNCILINSGTTFSMAINFAFKETIKKFENSTDENDRIVCESLKRCDIIWENIRLGGIEIYGLTYEQFCKQLEEKRNVVFLTDEEMENYKKINEKYDDFCKLLKFVEVIKGE